jgi:hypothetical protein
MTKYEKRLLLSIEGNTKTKFYTKTGLLIAEGYTRIVIGQRGPYLEFLESQIAKENIHIPEDQKYRLDNRTTYYNEWRTNDKSFVKIYEQKKTVAYADYKIGMWYISPFDLKTNALQMLVKPLKEEETDVFDEC